MKRIIFILSVVTFFSCNNGEAVSSKSKAAVKVDTTKKAAVDSTKTE